MPAQQSLKSAVALASKDGSPICRAINGIVGCPPGGWPETRQAFFRLADELPHRQDRKYSINDLVNAVLTLDAADRYTRR